MQALVFCPARNNARNKPSRTALSRASGHPEFDQLQVVMASEIEPHEDVCAHVCHTPYTRGKIFRCIPKKCVRSVSEIFTLYKILLYQGFGIQT